MTAKGKINASNLEAGMRIIVKTNVAIDFEGTIGMRESSTKTGENVEIVRVIGKTFRAAQGPYEARGKYVIETSAGTFEAAPIQTMFLAPEDAAGIKRAHAEALIEDEAFEAAKAEDVAGEDAYDAETIESIERIISTATTGQIDHLAKAIGDAWQDERFSTRTFDRLNRLHANRFAALQEPKPGDMIRRLGDGPGAKCFLVRDVTPFTIWYGGIGHDMTEGALNRPEWRFHFVRVASEDFRARARRCSNEWHRTGPTREIMLCPDCPL
jgi:hypothetical protein